ncbi:hypothetical protein NCR96_09260 [Helicobacter sp. 14348-15]|uniref:hypothetical protein n=1 Tax=Helicobacter colisuis TaxID=2949739 RepID=UPI00202B4AC8|nr:hypothetical protein [Helicobacter colisuis]MCL9821917.1 hypothetical protein [Helicobacter colisuis]
MNSSLDNDYSMKGYLRARYKQILKDKQRDERIQDYLCSFVLAYWDSIVRNTQKDIDIFLSEIFDVPKQKIEQYLVALERFKNKINTRDECLRVKIE